MKNKEQIAEQVLESRAFLQRLNKTGFSKGNISENLFDHLIINQIKNR
tara:strand:- start:22 stop:165 length:144 start_codon:yes stop_codon:yes gene_type:complete